MLTLNGKKMAKSTGNNILPGEILSGDNAFLSKAFSASVARFFMLQAHYRSILDFSDEAIVAAEKGYKRLMEAMESIKGISASATSTIDIASWKQLCYDAMNDDFNTPILIAQLFEGVRYINLLKDEKETLNAADLKLFTKTMQAFVFDVLGLEEEKTNGNTEKLEGVVHMLIGMRKQARDNKDFALSDQIRDQLIALGIQLKDGKEGTTFSL
jgi:cysteinyl-tRNA synthetase